MHGGYLGFAGDVIKRFVDDLCEFGVIMILPACIFYLSETYREKYTLGSK